MDCKSSVIAALGPRAVIPSIKSNGGFRICNDKSSRTGEIQKLRKVAARASCLFLIVFATFRWQDAGIFFDAPYVEGHNQETKPPRVLVGGN